MRLFIKVLPALAVCFFLFAESAHAVSVTITNAPSSIGSDPFTLSATVTGATPGTNYLRVDIYKDGTTNYFGQTFTGNDWYGGSDGTQYFPITIGSDKKWSGSVQARIGDTMPQGYDGTGTYLLRIRRYTSSGNYTNDEAKASAIQVALAFPTPTAVPTNTPTPAPTEKPTTVPKATSTPTPAKNKTALVTTAVTKVSVLADAITATGLKKSLPTGTKVASFGAFPTSVLGASSKSAEKKVTGSPKKTVMVQGYPVCCLK